jgi:beta-barrel assembly-enhancing protease
MYQELSLAKEAEESKIETPKEKKARLTKERQVKDIQSRKGYALGLNKVVFVNPYYKRIDERKKNQVRYQISEQVQLEFRKKLIANARLLNFEAKVLDPTGMKTNEIQRFNENSLLNEWFSDKLKHDEEIKMVSPVHNQAQALISQYGTSKFCWIGTISVTDNTSPKNKTLYYVLLYDIKTENLEMQSLNKIQQRDDNSILNSNIYYTILQMKYNRKK